MMRMKKTMERRKMMKKAMVMQNLARKMVMKKESMMLELLKMMRTAMQWLEVLDQIKPKMQATHWMADAMIVAMQLWERLKVDLTMLKMMTTMTMKSKMMKATRKMVAMMKKTSLSILQAEHPSSTPS